jgi:HlyD family secretion protein
MLDRIKNLIVHLTQQYINRGTIQYLWKNQLLVLIAIIGFCAAILFSFTKGQNASLPAHQETFPPSSPFKYNISGTGYVEANTRNISIGSFTSGIVSEVYAKEGQTVKKGDPLFCLDNRAALAEVALREKELEAAQSNWDVAKVNLLESQDLLSRGEKLKLGLVISTEEIQKRKFAVQKLEAQTKLQESKIEQAKAYLNLATIVLDKLTVKAPIDGLIMKVGIRLGERITEAVTSPQGLILMGNTNPLHIRVQIDENDAWRFDAQSKAFAYLKSNRNIRFALKLVRVEPYAQQKQQLSGESTELIDTRIIECVYQMPDDSKGIYIGQQMDVFIEARQES